MGDASLLPTMPFTVLPEIADLVPVNWNVRFLARCSEEVSKMDPTGFPPLIQLMELLRDGFVDVQMPILDGYGASLAIRTIQGEDRDGPHIVAITANDFVEDRKACLRSGMCRFAGKPLDWSQLMVLLKEGHESVHGRQNCRCRAQKRLQW